MALVGRDGFGFLESFDPAFRWCYISFLLALAFFSLHTFFRNTGRDILIAVLTV